MQEKEPELIKLLERTIPKGLSEFGYAVEEPSTSVIVEERLGSISSVDGVPIDAASLVQSIDSNPSGGNGILSPYGYIDTENAIFPNDLLKLLREHRPDVNPYCVLTFINTDYLDLLVQFLRHMNTHIPSLAKTGRPLLLVVSSPVKEIIDALKNPQEAAVSSTLTNSWLRSIQVLYRRFQGRILLLPYLVPHAGSSGFAKADIWRFRLRASQAMVHDGWTVSIMDVDAFVIKNLQPIMPLFPAAQPSDTQVQWMSTDDVPAEQSLLSMDVVASKGRFPYDLGGHWGQTGMEYEFVS